MLGNHQQTPKHTSSIQVWPRNTETFYAFSLSDCRRTSTDKSVRSFRSSLTVWSNECLLVKASKNNQNTRNFSVSSKIISPLGALIFPPRSHLFCFFQFRHVDEELLTLPPCYFHTTHFTQSTWQLTTYNLELLSWFMWNPCLFVPVSEFLWSSSVSGVIRVYKSRNDSVVVVVLVRPGSRASPVLRKPSVPTL